MPEEISTIIDPEMEVLRLNKESGFNYRKRRQRDWRENYTLYRDKVTINRLTQRQSVNIPLMKQHIRTLLKDVDDMPVLFFENLDNDKQAEVEKNEYWKWTVEQNKLELKDIVDKRQVFLFGRTWMQMQVADGRVLMTVEDPEDLLVSRHMDPADLDSSRFLIHTHIFVPLTTLSDNPDFDQVKVKELQDFYATAQGIVKASDNEQMMVEKNKKMQDMGVPDVDDPVLGETYIELTLHFVYDTQPDLDEEELFLKIEADEMVILMDKPLEEVIGVTEDNYWRNHFPYTTWADDLERQDFYSDSVADILRTPNKILNSWFSQLVENRTLRNFGMQFWDGTATGAEEFAPQTFNPIPWGWYKVPGDPNKVIKRVDIPDLSESLDEMAFLIEIAEKATGATTTQQGAQTQRQVTLGEVQLALGEAKERIRGMSKFYTPAWKERGEKFLKLVEAASDKLDAVKIYKKGRNTDKVFPKKIDPNDFMTKPGYRVKVWAQDEKSNQDIETIQKLFAAKAAMPDNIKLDEIYKMKLVEFSGLTPEQIAEIMEFEKQKREALLNNPAASALGPGNVQPGVAPQSNGATPPPAPRTVFQAPGQTPARA